MHYCYSYHPFRIEARQYIPAPGETGSNDFKAIHGDVSSDWSRLNPFDRANFMKNSYKNSPVLFTIVRNDGQRCCCKCPFKLLNSFVCCGCCQDGAKVYAGSVDDNPNGEKGRPFNLPEQRLMGSVTQPIFGGWCIPYVDIRGQLMSENETPEFKMEGPCCFGGWSECCCNFKFFVSRFSSNSKAGDVALIIKQKPQSIAGAMSELMSNADNYVIQFNPDAKLTGSQKATVLATQVLADYMFFEGNTEKCSSDQSGVTCYLWYCLCIGLLVPCKIFIPYGK